MAGRTTFFAAENKTLIGFISPDFRGGARHHRMRESGHDP
jgi:hypothetical protein